MSQFSQVERPGKYRGFAVGWALQPATNKGSVAVRIDLEVTEELQGEEWLSIADARYAPIRIAAFVYPIKQAGQVNESGVNQLVDAFGWDGDLRSFDAPPPDFLVQIDITEEEYNGKSSLKVKWLAHGDRPLVRRASESDVKELQTTVGSLLRAAAGAAKKDRPKSAPAPAAAPQRAPRAQSRISPSEEQASAPAPDQDIPF